MMRSEGVIGYKEERGEVYVHLDGRSKARIVIDTTSPPSQHLRLVSSTSEIDFKRLTASAAEFTTGGLQRVSVILGGAKPGSGWDIDVRGLDPRSATADAAGQIALDVPIGSAVDVSRSSPTQPSR